jgi:hypothetical protein
VAIVLVGLPPSVIVLALNGRAFLGYPGLAYGPPVGDADGYYAAARESISAAGRVPKPLAAISLLGLVACLGVGVALGRRGFQGWSVAAAAGLPSRLRAAGATSARKGRSAARSRCPGSRARTKASAASP